MINMVKVRKVPQEAIELAKRFEGFAKATKDGCAIPYLCPAGLWTIGYGHRCNKETPKITKEEAEKLLEEDLNVAMEAALRLCPILQLESDSRLAAITDFVFNLGATRLRDSTLRKRINEGDWEAAGVELRRWAYANGKRLAGLATRRGAEEDLLLEGE